MGRTARPRCGATRMTRAAAQRMRFTTEPNPIWLIANRTLTKPRSAIKVLFPGKRRKRVNTEDTENTEVTEQTSKKQLPHGSGEHSYYRGWRNRLRHCARSFAALG